jgi:hypothetical protein
LHNSDDKFCLICKKLDYFGDSFLVKFRKIFVILYIFASDFCENVFFCENVCENVKTTIFVSTLAVRPDKAAVCRMVP